MKKIILCVFLSVLVACTSNDQSRAKQDTTRSLDPTGYQNRNPADTATEAATTNKGGKGAALIAQSDCLSCHKEQEKLIGPAYAEVARKYQATEKNVSYLVDKVIKGGQGVWGTIPMTAHPALKEADAREMVQYILTIK